MNARVYIAALCMAVAPCAACDSDDGEPLDNTGGSGGGALEVPTTYTFESSFSPGESSVSYTGQTARHILISDLNLTISRLTDQIDGPDWSLDTREKVFGLFDYYFRFDSDSNGGDPIKTETTPPVLAGHASYAGISSGKNLIDKIAGEDDKTDHKDWDGGDFAGWSDESIAQYGGSIDSPAGLVDAFFYTLAEAAVQRANGAVAMAPDGTPLPVYVTESGLDLKQLIQKFLLMSVAFSQGTDDYLDDDVADKGLLASNLQAEGKPYTSLAHAWDEGFGYFGAARDYGDYTDEELAGKGGRDGYQGLHDSNGDGFIELDKEFNFGAAVNAAKRDLGAAGSSAPTDFTAEVFGAFLAGRALIEAHAGTELSAEQLDALRGYRDTIVRGWEKCLAATAVHYVNDSLADLAALGTDDFSFADLAKHWSELKGFALGLQFSPHSPLDRFDELHALIGDAPVDVSAEQSVIDAYMADLVAARDILMEAYDFPSDLAGDAQGAGGW